MRRRHPDPRQGLFRWVWSDPADDRPDGPDDEDEPTPGPLRARVRRRHAPAIATLWGVPVTLTKAPGRTAARSGPTAPAIGPRRTGRRIGTEWRRRPADR